MTTIVSCFTADGDTNLYYFKTREEAHEFAADVEEHDEDIALKFTDVQYTTRKQALSDLLGV